MTAWGAMSAEARSVMQTHSQLMREVESKLLAVLARMEAISRGYDAAVAPLIGQLDPGALLIDNNGLPGAVRVSKEEVEQTMADFAAIMAAYSTPTRRALAIKFAGLVAATG